jgi:hypothetical protein
VGQSRILLAVALFVAVSPLACKRGAATHKIGETAVQSDYKLTLLQLKECELDELDKRALAGVSKDLRALGAEVILEPTGEKVFHTPLRAIVADSAGNSYPGVMMVECKPPLLPKAEYLSKGKNYRGFITFHVPATATGLKLTYQPFVAQEQPVVFDLGR